jgi:hypothetical protein
MSLNIQWPPSIAETVKSRNNAEEMACFEKLTELQTICAQYRDRLSQSQSVGYSRVEFVFFWVTSLINRFQTTYRAAHPFSRALVRDLVTHLYHITRKDFDLAFKPYKALGWTKDRINEDRAKFHRFYDEWLID